MWLVHEQTPSHEAFKRFINNNLKVNIKQIFADINRQIAVLDTVDTSVIYIDGTKIEANATKFSFVWKKATITFLARLKEKINMRYPSMQAYLSMENKVITFEIEKEPSLQLLRDIHYALEEIRLESGIEFVHGKGTRKCEFQRLYEEFSDYREKMEKYEQQIRICGDRNSYSKTDHDATFMHGKEDYYMKTGIFNPITIYN